MHLEIKVHRPCSALILPGPERGCHRSAFQIRTPSWVFPRHHLHVIGLAGYEAEGLFEVFLHTKGCNLVVWEAWQVTPSPPSVFRAG